FPLAASTAAFSSGSVISSRVDTLSAALSEELPAVLSDTLSEDSPPAEQPDRSRPKERIPASSRAGNLRPGHAACRFPYLFLCFFIVVILIASAPFLPVFPEQVQDARRGRQQDQPGKGNRNRQLRDPRSRYPVRACRFRRRRFAFCGQAQALGVIQ